MIVLPVTFTPEVFQLLNSYCFVFQLPAAFLEEDPFELMESSENNLEKHDRSCINSNRDKNYPFSGLSRHEKVNIQKNKCQNCVVEEPISNEGNFFNQISLNSFTIVSFCPPRNVVHVAECINEHDVRVGTLKDHVADAVKEQFKDKFSMSWKMN